MALIVSPRYKNSKRRPQGWQQNRGGRTADARTFGRIRCRIEPCAASPFPGHEITSGHALTMMAALAHIAVMIIAIDGPAASGKGTLGKRLAHYYGYRHL